MVGNALMDEQAEIAVNILVSVPERIKTPELWTPTNWATLGTC